MDAQKLQTLLWSLESNEMSDDVVLRIYFTNLEVLNPSESVLYTVKIPVPLLLFLSSPLSSNCVWWSLTSVKLRKPPTLSA
jgi:hypothetical protein